MQKSLKQYRFYFALIKPLICWFKQNNPYLERRLPQLPRYSISTMRRVHRPELLEIIIFFIIFSILKVTESPHWVQQRTEKMSCHPDLPSVGGRICLFQIFQRTLRTWQTWVSWFLPLKQGWYRQHLLDCNAVTESDTQVSALLILNLF